MRSLGGVYLRSNDDVIIKYHCNSGQSSSLLNEEEQEEILQQQSDGIGLNSLDEDVHQQDETIMDDSTA